MQAPRRGLCPNARAELWRRWRAGQTLSEIGRALEKSPASVFGVVRMHGGFSPAPRQRRAEALSLQDREEISRGLSCAESLRCIAARLGRPVSTVAREVTRNGGRVRYRAIDADAAAWQRARRPKACKLSQLRRLQRCVAFKLTQNWSPEQVAAWLKRR